MERLSWKREKKGGQETKVLRYLLLSKPPCVFMPIPRFAAARSHRLNQVAPPNQFFLALGIGFFLHWMDSYLIFSCIDSSCGCCLTIFEVLPHQVRDAVRSRKFATAYMNRNIARLKETEENNAKLATAMFNTHVSIVCHYHLLTHKPSMGSPLVPRLETRSRLPKPDPWIVQDSLELVSLDS